MKVSIVPETDPIGPTSIVARSTAWERMSDDTP